MENVTRTGAEKLIFWATDRSKPVLKGAIKRRQSVDWCIRKIRPLLCN